MTSIVENTLTRADIRRLVRQRRRNLSTVEQESYAFQLSIQLQKRVLGYLQNRPTTNIPIKLALYLANDGELNPQPFIDWCWYTKKTHNVQIYLPVVHPFSEGNLLFFNYTPETIMTKNQFGISEPKLNITTQCSPLELDIIFTPLVAFDKSGNRLGMGGGFYDRTLSYIQKNQTQNKLTNIIGLAHQCQEVESLPIEAWDMPLAEIITPENNIIV